jgi:hypothetical protein
LTTLTVTNGCTPPVQPFSPTRTRASLSTTQRNFAERFEGGKLSFTGDVLQV